MHVIVVGCGVSGLTCGVVLVEAGHDVTIVCRDLPADTTSAVAAAIWYPYRAYPQHRVLRWAASSLEGFNRLAQQSDTGLRIGTALELHPRPTPDPWWKGIARSFERAAPGDLIEGYVDGWRLGTVIIEVPVYLGYLQQRLESGGGRIEQRPIGSLDEVAATDRVVVNCSGVFARDLCGDDDVVPVRGQVVRVPNPGLEEAVLIEEGPLALAYLVPRSSDVVVGGTVEEGEWALEVDDEVVADLLRKAAIIEPRLAGAQPLSTAVGLRAGRSSVRLEREERHQEPVVHNYGHGGSGFSLSWGCAAEVVELVG